MSRWIYVIAVVCLAVFVLPSSPVQLSYVYSDSMEPAISQDDGYLLVPAGTVESGDIITFYSEERGEYATHRVVSVTESGFVTQGDNNPTTDQRVGYPPVTRDDVLGKVATVGSSPLVFPRLGIAVEFVQRYWRLGLGGLVALFGLSEISRGTTRGRDVVRLQTLLLPLVLMAVVGTSAAFVLGAPAAVATFTVTDTPPASGLSIPIGEAATRTLDVEIGEQPAYTHQFIETSGMDIESSDTTAESPGIRVRIPAQSELGPYRGEIRLYRYPAILPYGVVASLQAVHPTVAALTTMSTLFGGIYILTWAFVDGKTVLQIQSRRRPLGRRLR
ncbi:signal peptidase I [Haloferax massiliensis]|uniref:Peptidase S24-like protein n=1 Tax=Haloferax massiliensis TaxID=1476858 RepID=A0A0D6JVN9_9EURY|nr:signal peptidase I [Haloferax massiliensis]CQR52567.1 Peptidase S24-like protein [Haloferax massiliensis]